MFVISEYLNHPSTFQKAVTEEPFQWWVQDRMHFTSVLVLVQIKKDWAARKDSLNFWFSCISVNFSPPAAHKVKENRGKMMGLLWLVSQSAFSDVACDGSARNWGHNLNCVFWGYQQHNPQASSSVQTSTLQDSQWLKSKLFQNGGGTQTEPRTQLRNQTSFIIVQNKTRHWNP